MDQREWDYGARLPRDRPAPEPWSTQNGPESTETPQWGSVIDTGSLEPIPEAVAWAERADAWAQQPPEQGGQWEQPVSRWSEVVPTGRPGFPADGVGWRTETAEWRATEQTARWRQTTEWRSASGTHGWRSTTEAWQTGSGAEGFLPPTDPSTRQQLAISGTAWPTPSGDDPASSTPTEGSAPWQTSEPSGTGAPWQPYTESSPTWQPAADPSPSWQQPPGDPGAGWQPGAGEPGAGWQTPAGTSGAGQPSGAGRPTWQQFAAPAPPPWQQVPAPAPPPWETPRWETPRWETPPASRPAEASWQQLVEPAAGGGQPADPVAAPDRTPSWSSPADDGRHLVREDDRERWRRESAAGTAPDGGPGSGGRRRASEAGMPNGGGTGWTVRSDADNWAGHTDTGSMPMFEPPPVTGAAGWSPAGGAAGWDVGAHADAPGWSRSGDAPSWTPSGGVSSWNGTASTSDRDARDGRDDRTAPGWTDRAPAPERMPRQRDSDITSARDLGTGSAGTPSWQRTSDLGSTGGPGAWRRGAVGGDEAWQDRDVTDARDLGGVRRPDTEPGSEVPSWPWDPDRPREIESGSRSADPDTPSRSGDGDVPAWQRNREAWQSGVVPSWQRDDHGRPRGTDGSAWRRDRRPKELEAGGAGSSAAGAETPDWRRPDRRDGRRTEPDSGGWTGGDEPRTDGWRRPMDADAERPGRRHTADSERDADGDRPGWRRDPGPPTDPWALNVSDTGVIPPTWRQPETDTGSWRAAPDDDRPTGGVRRRAAEDYGTVGRRRAIEGGARQEPVDPALWRREGAPRRAGANWPDEPSGDWRRELREQARRENPAEAATEIRQRIDPTAWQREHSEAADWQRAEREQAGRGSATYRGGGSGDWRRELAAQSDLADGESRRFGTQDFVPFRPVGSASVPAPPAAAEAPVSGPAVNGSREELLVADSGRGSRWQEPPDTRWPPRGATNGYQGGMAGGSYERRSVSSLSGPGGRSNNLLEPDDEDLEEDTGGPLAAVGYTVIWYGVPVVLFVLYMLVLNGSQQAHALSTLAGAAPQFGLSLVLSMLVAVALRWASGSWKAASVGLAAAVMGGGLATVLSSAITGNSLS